MNPDRHTSAYLASVRTTYATITKLRQKALAAPLLLLHPSSTAFLSRNGPISVVGLDRLEDDPEVVNSRRTPLHPLATKILKLSSGLHRRHGVYRRAKDATVPWLGSDRWFFVVATDCGNSAK